MKIVIPYGLKLIKQEEWDLKKLIIYRNLFTGRIKNKNG